MKKMLWALVALLPVLSGCREKEPAGPLRILAIGNSFSQDAVEQYLWNLFDAAGQEVVIGNLYIGGCTLERHWQNAQTGDSLYAYRKVVDGVKTEEPGRPLAYGLADEPWDVVTFQQASGVSGLPESYEPYLGELIPYVAARTDARFLFHETWAYSADSDHPEFPNYGRDQMTMYQAIMGAVQEALRAHPELTGVIPSGTAIQNGRATRLGDTFTRDGYHLELTYGRFTAACAWYETLSGKDVRENPWAPEGVDPETAALCKAAAHRACVTPFGESVVN